MKKLLVALFAFSSLLLLTPPQLTGQIVATTRPLSQISIGDHVSLGGNQFIKLNNDGLLMMQSTLSCPHGKIIAGKHVKCFDCPAGSTYNSTDVTCTCTDPNRSFNIDTSQCLLPTADLSNWLAKAHPRDFASITQLTASDEAYLHSVAPTSLANAFSLWIEPEETLVKTIEDPAGHWGFLFAILPHITWMYDALKDDGDITITFYNEDEQTNVSFNMSDDPYLDDYFSYVEDHNFSSFSEAFGNLTYTYTPNLGSSVTYHSYGEFLAYLYQQVLTTVPIFGASNPMFNSESAFISSVASSLNKPAANVTYQDILAIGWWRLAAYATCEYDSNTGEYRYDSHITGQTSSFDDYFAALIQSGFIWFNNQGELMTHEEIYEDYDEVVSNLSVLDVNYLDTSQCTDMTAMFGYNRVLEVLDLSNFNTSKVTSLDSFCDRCESLRAINLSSFDMTNVANVSFALEGAPLQDIILGPGFLNETLSEQGNAIWDQMTLGSGTLYVPSSYLSQFTAKYPDETIRSWSQYQGSDFTLVDY